MPPESRHPTGQLTFLWVLTTGASHKRVKGKNSCLILNARAWYGRVRPPIRCACGEIGRRARLRIWCRKAYRFESCQAHHLCPSLSKQREEGVFVYGEKLDPFKPLSPLFDKVFPPCKLHHAQVFGRHVKQQSSALFIIIYACHHQVRRLNELLRSNDKKYPADGSQQKSRRPPFALACPVRTLGSQFMPPAKRIF